MAKHETRARSGQTSNPPAPTGPSPDEQGIAVLAYQLWIERGCPIGSDQEDWFRAEAILTGRETTTAETGERRMAGASR
jgi:Protein of unknown function (DUF2934)